MPKIITRNNLIDISKLYISSITLNSAIVPSKSTIVLTIILTP
jgi:hypothetical protein